MEAGKSEDLRFPTVARVDAIMGIDKLRDVMLPSREVSVMFCAESGGPVIERRLQVGLSDARLFVNGIQ